MKASAALPTVLVHLVRQTAWSPIGSAAQTPFPIHLCLEAVDLLCSAATDFGSEGCDLGIAEQVEIEVDFEKAAITTVML
ncbi:MAG: hypothetical protein CBC48_18170 [bacterium TMED88]|nr:hypothetical protein [Deltaproteobacteria bacterium]OUV23820.1 MAG: hypothetical protein CBC48_18170 [bacterium TMED88]